MKRVKLVFVMGLFFLFMAESGMAQEQSKTFAVVPITIYGPQKYQYLERGIASMLTSRLTRGEEFRPIKDSSALTSWPDVSSQSQAERTLADIQADVLFWGSATITGSEASLDLNVLEAQDKKNTSYSQTSKVQDIIPALEDMVDSIHADLLASKGEPTTKVQPDDQATKPLNTQFVQDGITAQEGGGQAGLNPSFEYQTGAGKDQGKRQSQALPFASTGMIVDDADNDGRTEIFLLTEHQVIAMAFKEHRLVKLDTFEVPVRVKLLNINTLDMDRDKHSEIVVSGIFSGKPRSYILQFKEKKLNVLQEDIEMYLNVVTKPLELIPRLVGQKGGRKELFAPNVHEVIQVDGRFQLGRSLGLPSEANVFNFSYLPQGADDYKIIVADSKDRLRVFSKGNEPQYRSDEKFAASGLGLELNSSFPGMGQVQKGSESHQFYYIPTRLLPINLNRSDKYELLVSQNQSRAADFFPRYRHFPQGSIHSLKWDGLGLETVWKTRIIKGTVVDYGIGDINTNGQDELYVCVNTHPGALGTGQRKTMIITYKLNVGEGVRE
jgi:hypothetical protein